MRPRPLTRVLIYSHDSFGLGHVRRCRAIAEWIVSRFPTASVLILSGSPLIGSFSFSPRIDFVRVPGVVKLPDGGYASQGLDLDVAEVLELRERIIRQAALGFAPDLFIVDKEPLGLRGELRRTLAALRRRGALLILGLRDVLDDPDPLAQEWSHDRVLRVLSDLYDEIWVYGLAQFYDPLRGLGLPDAVTAKTAYLGYLRRGCPYEAPAVPRALPFEEPYILLTPGGGGDGVELVERVVSAYERTSALSDPLCIVFGPFMPVAARRGLSARAQRLRRVRTEIFDAEPERLLRHALGVVSMGGYNTFCEILSFDKPALVSPRLAPRREQLIRAQRAQALGLLEVLPPRARSPRADARLVAGALGALGSQPTPSLRLSGAALEGQAGIEARLALHFDLPPPPEPMPELGPRSGAD